MNNPRIGNVSVIEEKFTDDETCDLKVTQENFESIVRQLQEERRLNRQAERLAGLGFWEWDLLEDRLAYCSEGYAQMLDMSRDEMLATRGSTAADHGFIHADDVQRYAEAEELAEQRGTGIDIKYRAVTAKGRIRYLHEISEIIRDDSGKMVRLSGTVQDITALEVTELALKSSNDDLSRSNADLEQFAYVASHDLKAPLRSIEVLVGWLVEDLADFESEDVHDHLDLLKQRTMRLNRLLDDLLDYSRAGRKIGQKSRTDCKALVEDIATLLGVPETFDVVVDSSLPTMNTYSTPLEQVLRNLISNSIKHHPESDGTITVAAEQHDDHYLFSVADDGVGIPAEYAERVFEMFQTLRPRDEVEGSGMGLAIVNRIVNWQGGRIWFENPPRGTGAVFKFEWKLNPPELSDHSRKELVA